MISVYDPLNFKHIPATEQHIRWTEKRVEHDRAFMCRLLIMIKNKTKKTSKEINKIWYLRAEAGNLIHHDNHLFRSMEKVNVMFVSFVRLSIWLVFSFAMFFPSVTLALVISFTHITCVLSQLHSLTNHFPSVFSLRFFHVPLPDPHRHQCHSYSCRAVFVPMVYQSPSGFIYFLS